MYTRHSQENLKLNYIRRIPTDTFIYTVSQNIHNIRFAQTLLLRRICTADEEFQLNCNELPKKLTERGYKEQEINESIQRTQTFDRNELLKEKEKDQN